MSSYVSLTIFSDDVRFLCGLVVTRLSTSNSPVALNQVGEIWGSDAMGVTVKTLGNTSR
jgi:hypothetical protein